METMVTILVITTVFRPIRCKAIHNAINIRLNHAFLKEENKNVPASVELFDSKIPSEVPQPSDNSHNFDSTPYLRRIPKIGGTHKWMNQITNVLFPKTSNNMTYTRENDNKFLKIPIIPQSFSDYKVIVAIAPWNMRITGSEAKPVVIYLVFPADNEEPISMNVPEILFVKKGSALKDSIKKDKLDPVILVDSNRTVTGLKSHTVSKFIKFRNKINH